MGGNYEKGLYNQMMEVTERLDYMETSSRKEIAGSTPESAPWKKKKTA